MSTPTTLLDLVTLVRQQANIENTQLDNFFCTDQEITSYINYALGEMDDIMMTTYEDYKLDSFISVLPQTASAYTIPVPQEMVKCRGVDVLGNGTSTNNAYPWVPLKQFEWADRGRLNNWNPSLYPPYQAKNLCYHWQGAQGIVIYPQLQAQGTYQVWWYPKYRDLTGTFNSSGQLTNAGDVLPVQMDQQNWCNYAIADACIVILNKQNLDPSAFMQRKAELKQRIIGSMANRNAGDVSHIVHVRRNGGMGGPGGWGGWGGGGWW